MYSEHLHQNKAAVAALPPRDEASAVGIARIDKLLAHFHKGGKCHWRTTNLRNILWQSEIARLLATNIHIAKSTMDDYAKSVFTEMLIDIYAFCNDGIISAGDDVSKMAGLRDELVYAFLSADERKSLKKNSGDKWFFDDAKSDFISVLRETFNYLSGIGAVEVFNAIWTVKRSDLLCTRMAKYDDLMEDSSIVDYRTLLNVIIYAINILSGKLSDTLFSTEKHRLTNISRMLDMAEDVIKSGKHPGRARLMITDGREVAVLYQVRGVNGREYWTNPRVSTNQCRVFGVQGKKFTQFVAYTGSNQIVTCRNIIKGYKSYQEEVMESIAV